MNRGVATIVAHALFIMATLCTAVQSSEIARQLEQCHRMDRDHTRDCSEELESRILSKPASQAAHRGTLLTIRTRAHVVTFKDRPKAETRTIVHTYLGLLHDLGYHVVFRRFWEGDGFVLVSDLSSKRFPMSAVPHASPKAQRVVSVSASEAYNPNEIVIWRVTPKRLTQEFQYAPHEYALYKFLAWEGEDIIRLEKFTRSEQNTCPNSQFMTVREVLKHGQGKWRLSGETPAQVTCQ